MPDLNRGFEASPTGLDTTEVEGSVSLFVDDDAVLVVMHGAIGHHLHQDVRDLVDDLVSDVADTAHRPVRVMARDVTTFGLQGVWLLLELRRAARPASVVLLEPSRAVRDGLNLHGLTHFTIVDDASTELPNGLPGA
ncbi:STAS domain-containing protein [Angustibacter aerolatus]